ncbi:MAG TPA: glycosyl hydrolase 108 family protein [Allosphingosinicella sp.]|jgi:hypothetical protein
MSDIYSNPTIEQDRARGMGTAGAQAPSPGFFDNVFGGVGPGYRMGKSGPDWGWNQTVHEGRVLDAMRDQALKRGWRQPLPLDGDPEAYGQTRSSLFAFMAAERRRDPNLLPEYAGITDGKSLRAWVLEQRKRELSAAQKDADEAGAGLGGQFIGMLGAGITDPVNLIPFGGGAAKSLSVGRQILTVGAKQAGFNMALTAGLEPLVHADAGELGIERGARDVLIDLGVAGGLGGVLGAGFKAGAIGIERAMPLDRRVAGAIRDAEIDPAAFADVRRRQARAEQAGTAPDRAALDALDEALPREARTPDQQAAADVVRREAEIVESSPFEATPAGDDAHRTRLEEMLAAIERNEKLPDFEAPAPVPTPARAQPSGGGTSAIQRQSIIRFVINDLEGGAKVVHYSHADGGTTKWGVAAKFNPGVDVAALTQDQAIGIAVKQYWFAGLSGADPDVAAVAFDAGYISGTKIGKRILAQAGGDAERALALYRAHLNRIADTVPGKAKYKKGWNNRVDKLARRLKLTGSGEADAPDLDGINSVETRPDGEPHAFDPAPAPELRADVIAANEGSIMAAWLGEEPQPASLGAAARSFEPVDHVPGLGDHVKAGGSLKPEVLAETLGVSEGQARLVAAALARHPDSPIYITRGREPKFDAEGNVVDPGKPSQIRRRPKVSARPRSLLEFIADGGGLDDVGGNVRSMDGESWHRGAVGRRKLLRPRDPATPNNIAESVDHAPDTMFEAAIEAGYFPQHARFRMGESSYADLPDLNEFYAAIDNELRGRPLYRVEDAEALEAKALREAASEQEAELDAYIASAAERMGYDLDAEVHADALARAMDGQDYEDALDAAVMAAFDHAAARSDDWTEGDFYVRDDDGREWVMDYGDWTGSEAAVAADDPAGAAGIGRSEAAAGAAGQDGAIGAQPDGFAEASAARGLEPFEHPNGPEAQRQAESIEHDLQMDAFGGATASDRRAALERRGEGRAKGEAAQKPPGSDGGLFDAPDGQAGFRLDEDGDATALPALLDEVDDDLDVGGTARGCMKPGGEA